jgi:hypothetical protein
MINTCYSLWLSFPVRLALQLRRRTWRLALLAILGGLAVMVFAPAGKAQDPNATQQSQTLVAPASGPETSLPGDQAPRTALSVTYYGEQLTIVADNSTLSDILEAVHARTGAEIDAPASAARKPMAAVRLGPGPARTVLASLLSWTNFDYIIQAPDANSQAIQRVLLVARRETRAGSTSSAMASARQSYVAAPQRVVEPRPSPAEIVEAQNPRQLAAPAEVAPAEHPQAPAALESSPAQPQSKGTTQEMIQDMQRLFQQRRQQMEHGQRQRTGT